MDSLPDISSAEALTADSLFQNAFEFAAIEMALVSPEGKWLRVNRSVCDITGYSEAELLERTFQDITHPDDLDLNLANVKKMLAGKIKTYQMEKRYIHKNGSIMWVMLSVSLAHNKSGVPLFLSGKSRTSRDASKAMSNWPKRPRRSSDCKKAC